MNYRISATTLEACRRYWAASEEESWFTFERLSEQLQGLQETTPAMLRGTSFHEILETPPELRAERFGEKIGSLFIYRHLGHEWSREEIDNIQFTAQGLNEIKAEYVFEYGKDIITLVAKADKINALEVTDYKTTSSFDYDNYSDSVQWKIYCLAFDAAQFNYRVFEIKDPSSRTPHNQIKREHFFACYPYPEMKKEVELLAARFIEFCHRHGFYKAIGIKEEDLKENGNKSALNLELKNESQD